VREIRGLDTSLTDIAARMTVALDDYGSRLVEVDGIGPVLGVRLIGRTGRASRFPSPGAFASYAGAAPIEVSRGENSRHRLSRSGD
jgi:transposase